MITIIRGSYILLLSYYPCDIFDYYAVEEMHGLTKQECQAHANTADSAYIAGWSNYIPKESGQYEDKDPRFVFINLSRCTDPVKTTGLIMHEMMHQSMWLHDYNLEEEESIITWAEEETYAVYDIINQVLWEK
jgi:hypothetical protein